MNAIVVNAPLGGLLLKRLQETEEIDYIREDDIIVAAGKREPPKVQWVLFRLTRSLRRAMLISRFRTDAPRALARLSSEDEELEEPIGK